MKKYLFNIIFFIGTTCCAFAQKQNNVWFFGDKAGLDFNFTPPKAIQSDLITLEGTAAISDPAGHLLFFTNGATLWDRNLNPMPNGSGLLGGESSTQAALIVPLPGSCNQYYVFTTEDQFTNGGLAYSIVDMCLNEGLGDVVVSSKNTLVLDKTTEKVTAVLHANGVDIWIITHTHSSNQFQSYLLTSAGLNTTPVVSTIGAFYAANAIIGPIRASHNGSKIVSSASFHNICELFDFDKTTGALTNPVDLNDNWTDQQFVYGIEFSPNDQLLYLSTFYVTNYLYQLNLQTNQLTTLNSATGNYHFGALQMGPDKKIYMVRNESPFVDVIHKPDLQGAGCQYEEHSIDLVPGTEGRSGLPNFAPYSFFQDSLSSLSLGNDTTICGGDSIVLNVRAGKNCPSTYEWNDGTTAPGKIITESGTYWVKVESSCAIYIDTIQIDVVPASHTSFHKEICIGETFEGYDASGIYIDTFPSINGCDSIRTLNLTATDCQPDCNGPFAKTFGSLIENERGYSIALSEAEQTLFVGGLKNDSLVIHKLSAFGDVIWSRTFDIVPGKVDHINGMFVDSEGMLGVAGTSGSLVTGGTVFVFRYNPKTNTMLWSIELTSTSNSFCSGIIEMGTGGNYLLSNNPTAPNDAELIELDRTTGGIIDNFSKHYNLGSSETIYDMVYHGGMLYCTGRFTDGGTLAQMRNTLLKINPTDGIPEWVLLGHRPKSATARLYGVDLVIDQEQIYSVLTGDADGTSIDFTEIFVQKTSLSGEVIWLKKYDLPKANDWLDEIYTSGNGFIILARNRSAPSDIVLFKINHDGDLLWSKKFDFSKNDNSILLGGITSQIAELNNHIFFTAIAETGGAEDMILVKTNLQGELNDTCNVASDIPIIVTTVQNTTFYQVVPTVFTYIPESTSLNTSQGITSVMRSEVVCGSNNTIINEFEVRICEGETYEGYSLTGIYTDTLATTSGCDSIRILDLIVIPPITSFVEKDICSGGSFEGYTKSGFYKDTFTLVNGCDSIRTLSLSVISCAPIIHYDLEACSAFMFNGSNMDYTEFIPAYPTPLLCADITADYLYRTPPQMNKHSCTPGVNGSIAMCVSSINSCTYLAGNQASIVIEFTIHPQTDSLVKFTGLEFYEQAPINYNWISGDSGPNNYPSFYGIRILKNGNEIYRREAVHTTNSWTLQSYSFIDQDIFRIDTNTTFRIELLPYCPIGNASLVSAWDIDELKLFAGCIAVPLPKPTINGKVFTRTGQYVSNAKILMSDDISFSNTQNKTTDDQGHYFFDNLEKGGDYYLKGYKNDDVLNGVSTMDLIRIQKHLLGKEPFTSLHQYIAADINRNERVTVIDVIQLRKMLLGYYSEFPDNTSWRFGDLPQEMNGTDISSFRELKSVEYLENDLAAVNFLGIKIGDVNEDIRLLGTTKVESRSQRNLTLTIENTEITEEESFTVPIKLNQQAYLTGIQLALQTEDLEVMSIEGDKLSITPENYSFHDGVLSISWSQAEPVRLSATDELFRITFAAHRHGELKNKIRLATEGLRPEAYYGNDTDYYSVNLNFETKTSSSSQEISNFQVEPNPFHSTVNARFYLMNGGKTTIRFYDVSGRLLNAIEHEYSPGEHIEQISTGDIPLMSGVIYCQLICNGFTKMQRVLKL